MFQVRQMCAGLHVPAKGYNEIDTTLNGIDAQNHHLKSSNNRNSDKQDWTRSHVYFPTVQTEEEGKGCQNTLYMVF